MADFRKPDFKIYDDGNPIAEDVVAAVMQITVDDTVDGSALATVRLRDERSMHSDGSKFKVGSQLKIELGYVGQTQQVFIGEVTGWRGAFPRRGSQLLTVIAQDKFHRLRRNRRQKTFLEMKDSESISQVASACDGINSSDVATTPIKQNSIHQWNQSDADFILERASLFGLETFVDDSKLVVREPKLAEAPVATIRWHEELRHFTTAVSLQQQQKQLKVSAWNMKDKEAIEHVAKKGDERGLLGGTKPGSENVADLDGEFNWHSTTPANTTDEVQAYAKAIFQKRSERYLTGEGTCDGDPLIQRGEVIELEGLGEHLSGKYYARRVIHTLMIGSGYSTTFRVIRTAVDAPKTITRQEQESEEEPREAPVALLNPDWGGPGPMAADIGGSPHAVDPNLDGGEKEARPEIDGQEVADTDDPPDEGVEEAPETLPLRLRFADEDGKPFSDKPYELTVGDETIEGTTDADGRLEAEVLSGHDSGEITIYMDADRSGEAFTWPVSISQQG